ncbi:hypothetical protein AVEN_140159-1 [Araneus ventricosus]|uniref:Uncharacterized protein n=1 Tax=Araneus ventricosus TaxID=182803 RepID=A0A4Y2PY65_ARAVE|nr:hypothetical protein AVEN_140159-1 [Araneus ventricosus]
MDGRRIVKLPRKKDRTLSSDNYDVALQRLKSLQKKFKNTDLQNIYTELMQDYIDKNPVEIAPETSVHESRTFYLPHHVVKKQKNPNVKYRIVFDGSSHSPGHPSLNEVLEQGPNLLPEILATLLRFRLHKKAIIGNNNSRGISAAELSSLDTLRNGPNWLSQRPDNWPTESDSLKEIPQCTAEARKPKVQPLCTATFQPVKNASYFSSCTRLLRVTAWVLRFLNN